MHNFADEKIKESWDAYKYGSADDFFTIQFNALLQANASGGTLPFFNHVKKEPPRNGLNNQVMVDINKSTAELHSASIGAKENIYIFGKEASQLGLNLDTTKNMQPLLVCAIRKYGADRLTSEELNVAESGTKDKYQFMYNIEQFDERSQAKFKKLTQARETPFKQNLNEKRKEAVNFYKENLSKPEIRQKTEAIIKDNAIETAKNGTNSIFNAVMIHNIAQSQGGFDTIGKAYISSEKEIPAIEKMKIEIDKTKKLIADGKLPSDALIRAVFKGQKTAEQVISKDVSFEHKYQKDEKNRAKQNTHKLEYGFSR